MIRQMLALIATGLVANAVPAAEPNPRDDSVASIRAGFPALQYLKAGDATVAYAPGATLINKRRADLPASHPLHHTGDLSEDDVLLMETDLGGKLRVFVLFSLGPSADPEFYFVKSDAKTDATWGEVSGTALAIPGNGSIYTASRANSYFTKRMKFAVSPAGLREVKQPWYFVGLKSRALQPVTLYASPTGGEVIAQLPAGAELEVVLTDDLEDHKLNRTCFLVRTPLGLTGWVWVPFSQYKSDVIDGITWWGD